jgi:hypothetical protein
MIFSENFLSVEVFLEWKFNIIFNEFKNLSPWVLFGEKFIPWPEKKDWSPPELQSSPPPSSNSDLKNNSI